MGLAELFLGKENPFSKYIADNRQTVKGAFAGFGQGANFGAGLGNAAMGAQRGALMDDVTRADTEAEKQRVAQINQTAAFLRSKGAEDLAAAVEGGMTTGADAFNMWHNTQQGADPTANQNDFLFAKNNGYEGSFEDWMSGGSGGTEYGLTPIWGQMPDGTFAYGVQGKDGSFQPVDTGEMTPLDPRSLAGERAFGTQVGGAQGAAVAAAPSDIATGQIALDLIQQIKTSPELPWATGTSAGLGGNAVPGTGRFGFQNLVDQAKSGAFLSAIQEMRGMGALSNAEGQTATQAITRMNTALSQADFVKALDDYERIVRTGVQRAQGRVGSGPSVGSTQTPSSGQNFVYNPTTGQLEPQ